MKMLTVAGAVVYVLLVLLAFAAGARHGEEAEMQLLRIRFTPRREGVTPL